MATSPSSAPPGDKKEVKEEWKKNPPHLDGVPDMSALIYLEGPNVLHNLACRYRKSEIYTSISKVLIAINPYSDCVDYGGDLIEKYRKAASARRQQLPPHVFSVSQLAYFNLVKYKENQSMIVCGESGSGKTESAKHLMRYLAYSKEGGDKVSMEKQVLDANPILESFGNAKTILNWNSSRFGKFTKIVFGEEQDRIVGSFIETYLLEKSRVVQQETGERNYHSFYYLCAPGAIEPEWYKEWSLSVASDFHYTNQGGEIKVKEVSDPARYKELKEALTTLNFTPVESKDVLQVVAGILHMGNVTFSPNTKDLAEIKEESSKTACANAARLFQVEEKQLAERLCTSSLKIQNQVITKPLNCADAIINRDAIAKALYHGLFLWVVSHINATLFPLTARSPSLKWIGILDVFGFESFENNSFEQFCINFANERLQQYFNQNIIKSEQDLYRSESIMWTPIKVPDNQDCIDLIDGKTKGILVMLDSACKMPKGDDVVFIRNLFQMNKYHPRMRKVERVRNTKTNEIEALNGFSIHHYAGKVIYNATEFLAKNMDQTSPDTVKLFCGSNGEVTKQILEDEEIRKQREEEKKAAESKAKTPALSAAKGKMAMFESKQPVRGRPGAGPAGGARVPETAFKSVGAYFSQQLEKLMNTLYQTTPFFVRCIKPNKKKIAQNFDNEYVRPQLECGGIIEALRILKCGFPSRCTYDAIFKRYGSILKPTPPNLNKRDFCEAVLRNAGETLDRAEFQLGLSRVFFRPGKQAFLEELLEGDSELPTAVVEKIRMFLLNKRLQRARGAVRVHISFKLRLRQKRALIKVWKLFRLSRVLAATVLIRIKKLRLRLACLNLQAVIKTHELVKIQKKKKKAAVEIENFYMHNRFRKRIKKELQVRIEKKRAQMAEAKRKELERLERERKDKEIFEAVEREKRKAHDEAEKVRKEREKLENAKREAEERERQRLEKEKYEREREQREKEEELRKAKEAEKVAREEAKRREEELQRQIEQEKESIEQFKKEEQERKLALDIREFELNEKEKKLAAAPEAKVKETVDAMAHLLNRGTTFFRHEGKIEEANTVHVNVGDDGVLKWIESDTATETGETPQGEVKLKFVTRIRSGPRKSTGRDEMGKDVNLFLVLEYSSETDEKQIDHLELQAGTPEMRDKWITALRYCVRNMKELGTVSRPKRDLARGNILAAMLTDELNELKEKTKKLKSQLAVAAKPSSKDKAGTLEPAPTSAPAVTSTSSTSAPLDAKDQEELKKLKAQVEQLKKLNTKLTATAKKEKQRRKSTQQQQALTSLLEEKKKILILEEKNQQLTEQNKKLTERNQVLMEELETQKVIHADDRNAAKLREEQLKAEIERKLTEARENVENAESKVVQAETAVRKRQDVIRNAMKTLAERKTALSNTEQTMQVLGITGADPTTLEDTTARRLAELHGSQKREQQEAEAVLLKEYAAMVAEAESLNEMNEELARKTYVKEKHEQLHKQMAAVQAQRSSAMGAQGLGLPTTGGGGGGSGGGGGGAGAGPGGKKPDDGCIIC